MGEKIEVLIVDDSPFIRRAVQRMLAPVPEVEVVGTAANGREAVEQTRRLRPDLVILDIVMPEVDGLEAIRRIMESVPTAILVLSSQARPGAAVTLKALELGAVDFVSKGEAGTRMDIYDLAPILQEKVRAVAASRVPPIAEEPAGTTPDEAAGPPLLSPACDVVVMGASTGGPRALAGILGRLPADFPAGIVVAQHMPPGFTATLAERLDRRSRLSVREAVDGDRIEPGLALVGVGGRQLRVERVGDDLLARVPTDTDRLLHRPSVDLLFASVAEAAGSRALGVVLTGMGEDGAKGMDALRRAGGRTMAESEETAVIYGMPKAAAAFAEYVLPLEQIPGVMLRILRGED